MILNTNSQTIRYYSLDDPDSIDNRGKKYLQLISTLLIYTSYYLNMMQKYILLKSKEDRNTISFF